MSRVVWTAEDIQLLKEEYPLRGCNIPELLLKYTKKAIGAKALKLKIRKSSCGLKRNTNNMYEDHLGNEYPSFEALCLEYGKKPGTVRNRLKYMSLSDALVKDTGFAITDPWGKRFNSAKEMAEFHSIPYKIYISRIRQGWSIKRSLTIPVIKEHSTHNIPCSDHLGNMFTSIKAKCEHYGLSIGTYSHRIKNGMSEEQALLNPVKKQAPIMFRGEKYDNLRQLLNRYDISPTQYYKQVKLGRTLEDMIKYFNRRTVKDHLGKEYKSLNQLLKSYGITKTIYFDRKRKGWSLERILTTPPERFRKLFVDQSFLMKCGLNAKIIELTRDEALIRAEDGEEWWVRRRGQKVIETSRHPILWIGRVNKYKNFIARNSIILSDKTYWECECTVCGKQGVMTPQEMMEHAKTHEE